MEPPASVHPADETLVSYGLGKLDDTAAESVNEHLEQCATCRRRVAELSSDSFVERLREAQARPGDVPARPQEVVDPDPPRRSPFEGKQVSAAIPLVSSGTLPPELVDDPQYEVIRELGCGGMGVVYLARSKMMDRLEVLKVLNKEMLARQGMADRFLREIQSAAKLHHPNVVTAYAAFQMGNLLVFAMEYVEGDDLAKLVRDRGPLPVVNACYFAYQAAQGLQHAHERGMVHRDIKPGNLILFREGKKVIVKILDFGLAKVRRRDFGLATITSERGIERALTQHGVLLGTADYIAPEQIDEPQKADIRADIYSLGCTLYHLLAGDPPFLGTSLFDVLLAHRAVDAKPLNLVRPAVPVELAAVVAKMMAKDPNRRYQTPEEIVQALKPFFRTGDVSGPHPNSSLAASRFGGRRLLRTKLVLVTIVVGLLIAWSTDLFNVRTKHGVINISKDEPRLLTVNPTPQERLASASPAAKSLPVNPVLHSGQRSEENGSALARPAQPLKRARPIRGLTKSNRTVLQLTDKEILTLTGHTGAVHAVAFSPDGKWIASGSSDNTVKIWDASNGQENLALTGHSNWVSTVQFSPDAKRILSGGADDTVRLWDVASGEQTLTLQGHTARVTSVAFSPDGKHIVSGGADHAVKVWDAITGQEILTLKTDAHEVWSVAFSPDGKHIVSGGADHAVKVWDAITGQETLTLKGTGQVESVAFSPDGRLILAGSWDGRTLKLWDAATGQEIRTLKGHPGAIHAVAFSPDAKWIACGGEDGTIKLWDGFSGQEALTLNGHTGDVRGVAFSPDGKRIVSGSDDATIKIWNAPGAGNFTTQNMQVEILRPGRGDQEVKLGDFLTVNYKTTLADGKQIDSTYALNRRPLTFKLGTDPVLKGWHLGLLGMKFGELRRLTIPPDLAFGSRGSSVAGIPKDATLISEIELLAIHEGGTQRVRTRR